MDERSFVRGVRELYQSFPKKARGKFKRFEVGVEPDSEITFEDT
jgi:hypothetical protein